ncbi:MAG: DMT family transporter [Gemmobacter sp.]|uniref:DMT family transporter n=1 Tax=Gemmobacter sp. TaxID=1898957 RepID=UPI00391AA191
MSPWVLVAAAGVLEVFWAIALKYADGFTRFWPSVAAVTGAMASFWLLSLAMRSLPAGTAYAVWVGIGTLGVASLGIALFGEATNPLRLAGVALIVAGILVLKLA